MREHVFLCGLSTEQIAQSPAGTTLSLEKSVGNLKLKLDQVRGQLVGDEPERLTDFIEIASYVFAADRMTKRGAKSDPGVGAEWRRNFHLVIAVRELGFWSQADVRGTLAEALDFLSEDTWRFDFKENQFPIPLQQYLKGLKPADDVAAGNTSIVLFSGGLDSLAGAVHELRKSNRHVVLVSHLNLPGVGQRQKQMAATLAEAYPRRVTHVWVKNNLTKKLDQEETQRTRSFFFTAVAAVAAHIEGADRIRFFENGVMSINLPIATQVVGARSSRSTHPRSLQLLGSVIDQVALHPITIDNPFIWKTKIEVVRELAASPHANLITTSVSCTRARTVNRTYQPHCGTCIQCLHRRFSTSGGGAGALDEDEGYEIDFWRSPREDGHERVMALETINLALDCADISAPDFVRRFIGPLSWVLQAHPPCDADVVTQQVVDLFRQHGAAVRELLIETTKPMVPEIINRSVSPDSLVALLLAGRLGTSETSHYSQPEDVARQLPNEEPTAPGSDNAILIAIDEHRKSILIKDWPELSGPAIFPIMKLLIEILLEERSKPGHPEDYKSLRAKVIADRLKMPDDEAVRAAISRARNELQEAAEELGYPFDQHAIIETTAAGYRINPALIVVPAEKIRRR